MLSPSADPAGLALIDHVEPFQDSTESVPLSTGEFWLSSTATATQLDELVQETPLNSSSPLLASGFGYLASFQ